MLLPLRDEADRVTPVPARRCSPSAACPACGSWCSTTAPPTAPPTWSARWPATTRGSRLLTGVAAAAGLAGQAARLPAAGRRRADPAADRAGLRGRRRGARPARAWPRPSPSCARAGATLLSPYPRIVVATAADRLVQPLLQWSWLTFLPLRAMERSRAAVAGRGRRAVPGGGPGRLHRRPAGTPPSRDKMLEDIELARAVKRAGGRIALADGSRLADLPDVRRLAATARRLHASRCGRRSGIRARRRSWWRCCSCSTPPRRWSRSPVLAAGVAGGGRRGPGRLPARGGRAGRHRPGDRGPVRGPTRSHTPCRSWSSVG